MNRIFNNVVISKFVFISSFLLLLSCSRRNVTESSIQEKWHRASLEIENSHPESTASIELQDASESSAIEESNIDKAQIATVAYVEKPAILSVQKNYKVDSEGVKSTKELKAQKKGNKKSINKSQIIKQIKRVSSNVKTGLILILVGLGISLLIGPLLGGTFYTIGGVVIVVGIVFLILGILGI